MTNMAKQYNMYNVQLSEFWKQRVGKESLHNAPYMDDDDNMSVHSDTSRVSGRPQSEMGRPQSEMGMSVTSETSRAKVTPK